MREILYRIVDAHGKIYRSNMFSGYYTRLQSAELALRQVNGSGYKTYGAWQKPFHIESTGTDWVTFEEGK